MVCWNAARSSIAFCAQLYAGKPEFGNFTDAGGIIAGLEKYAGRTSAVLFAIALFDAAVIGAAVGLRKLRREPADGTDAVQAWPEDARDTWRMPPLDELPPPNLTLATRVWMGVLRSYLLIAVALVIVRVVQMTLLT